MSKQRGIIGGAVGAILGLAAGVGRFWRVPQDEHGRLVGRQRKSARKTRNRFHRVAPPPPRGGMRRPVKPRLCESLAPTHPLVRWIEGHKTGETA